MNVIAWREKEKVNKEQDANLWFDRRTDYKMGQEAGLLSVNMIELFPQKGLFILSKISKTLCGCK